MSISLRRSLLLSLFVASISSFAADDGGFRDFVRQQREQSQADKTEFDQYLKELEKEFRIYKKTYDEAFATYKSQVSSQWGEFKSGGRELWVSYEDQGRIRRSVDFETGKVVVEKLIDSSKPRKADTEQLKSQIGKLFGQTEADVFRKDTVAQSVEKAMRGSSNVVTGKTSNRPALAPLLPKMGGSKSSVSNLAKKYADKAKLTSVNSAKRGKKILRLSFDIPRSAPQKSKAYLTQVQRVAKQEKIPVSLMLAVMETESGFNPLARSHIPAYGLMQIVPRSAGMDATKYLFGRAKILSPSYLYNSDNNIRIGAAYLHILYFNYLSTIDDPVSRLYCTIAAYNTGAGNVGRAFGRTSNVKRVSAKINQMTPKQVYGTLVRRLPHKETKDYLKRVSQKLRTYQISS